MRARADEARERAREEAAAVRAELVRAVDQRAAALGRAEAAETEAARLAGRCERLARRLYPDGGAPATPEAEEAEEAEAEREARRGDGLGVTDRSDPEKSGASSDSLLVLRATLEGHPVGHDLDVTAALRARARTRGNRRLVIGVSENLRADLFGDAFPRVHEGAAEASETLATGDAPRAGRLIIEYARAGAYYGGDAGDAAREPDASAARAPNVERRRGAACVATVVVGGVDTNEPFAVSSLWLEASPAAADAAARHAETRVRDAERAFADVKAKLTRAEARVAELTRETVALSSRCEAAERGAAALAEAAGASAAESRAKTRDALRFETEARRAVGAADAARARARQAVDAARDEAERRVAEAVREERLRLEQKAREVRLAGAAARRRRAGEPVTAGSAERSAWGVPRAMPSTAARTPRLEAASSPLDAGYKTRKKASAAAAAEAEAWAAARASAAAEVAAEVTRARRAIRSGAASVAASDAGGPVARSGSGEPPAPARVPRSPADEGRRRAEARVREFQRREVERLER